MIPFHYSFVVNDLDRARWFYHDVLGCELGRTSDTWIDFDFFGHQLSAHCVKDFRPQHAYGNVDKKDVPVPHFGAILSSKDFQRVLEALKNANIEIYSPPEERFQGTSYAQNKFFLADPSGNFLEFKHFPDPTGVFAQAHVS